MEAEAVCQGDGFQQLFGRLLWNELQADEHSTRNLFDHRPEVWHRAAWSAQQARRVPRSVALTRCGIGAVSTPA
jgi:hypothetical protein